MAYARASEDDLAEMQKLSSEYEPEVKGPLVGQRQPSTAITTEYASADPVYQAKTTTLPQTYSHYRTIRGDGKCGWRAVAFGYFEALINTRDESKLHMEEARLRATSNLIARGGFDVNLVEDFADETFGLLRKLSAGCLHGNAEQTLLDSFNDDSIQNYIITHLRTLAAAWMKTHQDDYAGFLLPQTVDDYCENTVLPVGAEIDNFGLSALHSVLLSPAGITLEVLYLDRSEGTEVNIHVFENVNGSNGYYNGNMRLLYRPGHYDILYKPEDVPHITPPPVPPVSMQTDRSIYAAYGIQSDEDIYEIGVPNALMNIPGFSMVPTHQAPSWMPFSSSPDLYNLPAPVPTATESLPMPTGPTTQVIRSRPMYPRSTTVTASSQLALPPTRIPTDLSMPPASHGTAPNPEPQTSVETSPFRPSAWQLEPDFVSATSQMPLQTAIFRNSHFNTAHFMNPDFQPEQWDPEDEYSTSSSSGKSSRQKSTG